MYWDAIATGLTGNDGSDNSNVVTLDNAVPYLIGRSIMDASSIVEGDLEVIDASRRNRNLQVVRKNGTSFLIKQPSTTDDAGNVMTIKKEALLYLLMQTDANFASLKDIAPRILDFDEQRTVMITEFVTNAHTLNNYERFMAGDGGAGREGEQRKQESAELGRLMAKYHKVFRGQSGNRKLYSFKGGFVPAASIVRPGPEIFRDINSQNLELLKIIQRYPTFYDSLEELYSSWQNQTLIHGDIKWDNVIVSSTATATATEDGNKGFRMNIVDWESVSMGDPAWDVGSVFQEFIRLWLSFLPATGRESAERLLGSTTFPIQKIQPEIRAFWNSYVKTSELTSSKEANELLVRSAKFCAARLVQSAYEALDSSMELSNTIVYMIQTSMNIFNRTNHAIVHLLGIPFRGGELI